MDTKTRLGTAEELAEMWTSLSDAETALMLTQNIPAEIIEFCAENSHRFVNVKYADEKTKMQFANCLLAGYILRILEERL